MTKNFAKLLTPTLVFGILIAFRSYVIVIG